MRKFSLAASLLSTALFITPQGALACGDKLVDASRGVRFQRANAGRHASIVLFLEQGPKDSANKIKSSLTRAGHKVEIVNDPAELKEALEARNRDLVVTDIDAVPSVKKLMATTSSKALVIPRVQGSASKQLTSANQQYPFVLSSPGSTRDLILTIDKAIKSIAVFSAVPKR